MIDYDHAFVASETEAKEILAKAKEFADVVEQWIAKNHPRLRRRRALLRTDRASDRNQGLTRN